MYMWHLEGSPCGCVGKSADFINTLNHSIMLSGVGLSPTLGTCEVSQVLLADVKGVFSWDSPVFTPSTDWPVSYELK